MITLSQSTFNKLSDELENVLNCVNPLDYKSNSPHYQKVQLKNQSAFYVMKVGKISWFLAAALKYLLRRRHKGQYIHDVVKIVHCLRLSVEELRDVGEQKKTEIQNFLQETAREVHANCDPDGVDTEAYFTALLLFHFAVFVVANNTNQHRAIEEIAEILKNEAKLFV